MDSAETVALTLILSYPIYRFGILNVPTFFCNSLFHKEIKTKEDLANVVEETKKELDMETPDLTVFLSDFEQDDTCLSRNRDGKYVIPFKAGMLATRPVLKHEMAHYYYRDEPLDFGGHGPRKVSDYMKVLQWEFRNAFIQEPRAHLYGMFSLKFPSQSRAKKENASSA
jgi:hypothetical protein